MTPLIVIYIKAITLQPLELWLFSLLLSKSYTNKKRTDKNVCSFLSYAIK